MTCAVEVRKQEALDALENGYKKKKLVNSLIKQGQSSNRGSKH